MSLQLSPALYTSQSACDILLPVESSTLDVDILLQPLSTVTAATEYVSPQWRSVKLHESEVFD